MPFRTTIVSYCAHHASSRASMHRRYQGESIVMDKSVQWAVFVLLLIPSMLTPLVGQTMLQLPPPNGCHAVGTRLVVFSDASRKRDLIVTFWYPSLSGIHRCAGRRSHHTWTKGPPVHWRQNGECSRILRTSSTQMPASKQPWKKMGPFRLFFWNMALGSCRQTTPFLRKGWPAKVSLWQRPITRQTL